MECWLLGGLMLVARLVWLVGLASSLSMTTASPSESLSLASCSVNLAISFFPSSDFCWVGLCFFGAISDEIREGNTNQMRSEKNESSQRGRRNRKGKGETREKRKGKGGIDRSIGGWEGRGERNTCAEERDKQATVSRTAHFIISTKHHMAPFPYKSPNSFRFVISSVEIQKTYIPLRE